MLLQSPTPSVSAKYYPKYYPKTDQIQDIEVDSTQMSSYTLAC